MNFPIEVFWFRETPFEWNEAPFAQWNRSVQLGGQGVNSAGAFCWSNFIDLRNNWRSRWKGASTQWRHSVGATGDVMRVRDKEMFIFDELSRKFIFRCFWKIKIQIVAGKSDHLGQKTRRWSLSSIFISEGSNISRDITLSVDNHW